jgi:SAM-dependent methyltransferase
MGQEMTKSDYGIDAPGIIRNFYLLGTAMVLFGWFLLSFPIFGLRITWLGTVFMVWGIPWIVASTCMILYSKRGKFKHRDRMLNLIDWRGDERVLDVGTGRGLLMIAGAKRLTTGKCIGIDIWNGEDLSGNSQENTKKNIRAEGVEAKTELRSEDVCKMSFADNTFDVVFSNLCLHNIAQREQREQAYQEIVRVLKPGGVALISDFQYTKQVVEAFRLAGLKTEVLGPYWKDTFPSLSIVVGQK